MPILINGCGTMYYGRRRIHRVKSGCEHCRAFAELESYDTTLYFVMFLIPILPLGKKRVLEQCPVCKRHRIVSLKDWEAGKSKAFGDVLEKLQANPDDRDTIRTALGLATVYQDEAAFDKLAEVLVGHRTNDAEIQAQLGAAYEYFSRWTDAEAAYRRALAIAPDDDIRQRLAVCLLKQDRPEEATEFVAHVIEKKDQDNAWLPYWLVEGFMAKGMHEPALALMDVRDQAFPELARLKDYRNQRKAAEKNRLSGKPIASKHLRESSKTGFREGSGLGFKWPKYVAGALALGLLALYLGVAIYRGQNRKVYLVNGWTKPYAVAVNGKSLNLRPGGVHPLDLAEGDVTIQMTDIGEAAQTVRIETSFWTRPFRRPVFVLNPDRTALVTHEQVIYTANANLVPSNSPDFNIATGRVLHEFPEVDHEFEAFPTTVPVKAGSTAKRTRVGLLTIADARLRIEQALSALAPNEWPAYARRLLELDPDDGIALEWLTNTLAPDEALKFLRPRLADRPARVEWHRQYQNLIERTDIGMDLLPEYRALVEETKRSSTAVYLLGRLESGPVAEKLFEEAATANPPSAHACAALGNRFLSRGEFAKAVTWTRKAFEFEPRNAGFQATNQQALLAAGEYRELLARTGRSDPIGQMQVLRDRLTAHLELKEPGGAEGEIQRLLAGIGVAPNTPAANRVRAPLDLILAQVQRDRGRFIQLAGNAQTRDEFSIRLLQNDHRGAAADLAISQAGNWIGDTIHSGLLYLAARKAKDDDFAKEHWSQLEKALAAGDRHARRLADYAKGKIPFDLAAVRSSPLDPSVKRIVLAAFAKRFPDHAAALNELSTKLDFTRDDASLCLRYVGE